MPTVTKKKSSTKVAVCEQCHEERNMDSNRKICYGCRSFSRKLSAGQSRPPEFAEVNIENYKEPMQKVEDGFGYYGAITTTNDDQMIQCHICGYYFANVGTHVRAKHKIAPRDYKVKYGLRINDGLVSPIEKERLQLSYNTHARKTPEEFREMSRKAHAAIKDRGIKLGGNNWGPQTRNEKGMCREQTIGKIKSLAETLGKVPSQLNFYHEYGLGQRDTIEYWFGNWTQALVAADMPTWDEQLAQRKLDMRQHILDGMRSFYEEHGRTPQWSDFSAGKLDFNAKTVQYHYGTLNAARQDAGVPILVYSSSQRTWVEIEPGQEVREGDYIRMGRGMVPVTEGVL